MHPACLPQGSLLWRQPWLGEDRQAQPCPSCSPEARADCCSWEWAVPWGETGLGCCSFGVSMVTPLPALFSAGAWHPH